MMWNSHHFARQGREDKTFDIAGDIDPGDDRRPEDQRRCADERALKRDDIEIILQMGADATVAGGALPQGRALAVKRPSLVLPARITAAGSAGHIRVARSHTVLDRVYTVA
jgi:hypothetical protein